MSNLNTHIEDFLKYYCGLSHAPQYAVLIKGPWGSGKTHLIERFFEGYTAKSEMGDGKGPKYLYVSLYGIKNTREIEDAFFTQLHPVLGSKGMRVAGKIMKGMLKASLKIDVDGDGKADGSASLQTPDIHIPDYVKNSQNIPLVFDDLERCSMSIKDILGYINSFAEHSDCKVIILGDEDKILDEEEKTYKLFKEKLIGKTFEVRPEFQDAFNFFLKSIDETKVRNFYSSKCADIQMLFDQSGSKNLRTLQRSMWDFERFASCLTKEHMEHHESMRDIFRVFMAMSFEIKAGRITGEEIAKFGEYYWVDVLRKDQNGEITPTQKLKQRYPEVPFDQTLLSNEILADVLGKSILDKTMIHESLNQHPYFSSPETEAAWRILWDATRRDQDLVAKSLADFEAQFTERKFKVTGEILHVAGIRLWLSEIRAIKQSRAEVFEELKSYALDLYNSGKLESSKTEFAERDDYFGSYGGLGFREIESVDFQKFSKYLRELQIKALEDSYQEKARALLNEMAEDTDLYFRRLCINNTDDHIYYDTPILSYLEPTEFVNKVLELTPAHQHTAISVFKARYEHGSLTNKLANELPWLESVSKILKTRANQMDPIPKHAVEKMVHLYIEPSLSRALKATKNTP